MLVEYAVYTAYTKVLNDFLKVEYMKSKTRGLTDSEKQEFSEDESRRFLHFTSKENAEKIMQSGFLLPSKGVIKNHFTRKIESDGKSKNMESVYMFDSKALNVQDYIRNLPNKMSPSNGCYEYYAISTKPNVHEIENFQKRAQDGAILYDGRMDIDGTDTKLTKFVLGLDEQGEYKFDEVPLDFEYIPKEELKERLAKDKRGNVRYTAGLLLSEIKLGKTALKKYRLEKQEYKDYIDKKRAFAKANRQFKEEEKEKSYVYSDNGKTLAVKNLEYEMVDGKKLQKVALIENDGKSEKKDLAVATKVAFMDECDLSKLEPEVAKKYFFSAYEQVTRNSMELPEYIGLPEYDLKKDEVVTKYDESFKKDYDMKVQKKEQGDRNYAEYKKSKSKMRFAKIKNFFNKIFGNKKDVKLLGSGESEAKKTLSEKPEEETCKEENSSFLSELEEKTYSPEQVMNYDMQELETNEVKTKDTIAVEEKEIV